MNQTDPEQAPFVGDLLLLFGVDRPPQVVRSIEATWLHATGEPIPALWQTAPGTCWRGTPCVRATRGAVSVALLGELYGIGEAQAADLLLDVATGIERADRLNGHFLLIAWDEDARELRVWTDRFGTLHAYHAAVSGRAAVGTFCPAVAAAASARRLDWEALAGFFGFGFFPHDRTHFDDVRILRPASLYRFDAWGGLVGADRYLPWRHSPDMTRSYADTVAEFAHVFGCVMADHLSTGRIAVPISGGLDSRSTVAEIRVPDNRVWAYSYGYSPDSVETRIARRIAQSRALSFDAYTIGPYLFDGLDGVLAAVEGFQDITQCRQAAVAADLACRADYVIAAHWGDVWLDDMGLVTRRERPADADGVVDHALHKMEKRGREWLFDHLVRPSQPAFDPDACLGDFVRHGMDGLGSIEDPDFRVKAFKTDNWSFRWTMTGVRMYQPGAFPRLPFYDTRIADFFGTVPSSFVAGRRLQIDYLKRHAPDLARITWQVFDADLYRYSLHGSWLLPKRGLKKLARVLSRRPVVERNWEVQFAGEQGSRGLDEWLLRPGLRLHDLVAPKEIAALLSAFRRAPLAGGHAYSVSMLLTFSVWLERYG